MQPSPDILVTCCLADCRECTGLYGNDIFASKIVCTCRCHKEKKKALDRVRAELSNDDKVLEPTSRR